MCGEGGGGRGWEGVGGRECAMIRIERRKRGERERGGRGERESRKEEMESLHRTTHH